MKNMLLILCAALGFIYFTRGVLGIGTWKGSDFEVYRRRAHSGSTYYLTELPQGAKDFRFKCTNMGMGAHSYAAFTLEGDAYEDFISSVLNEENSSEPDGSDFVGKKVSDTFDSYDDNGQYIGFPEHISDYVIDDDIKDYTIISFSSYNGAGSSLTALAANPYTGRVVIVYEVVR